MIDHNEIFGLFFVQKRISVTIWPLYTSIKNSLASLLKIHGNDTLRIILHVIKLFPSIAGML